MLLSESGSVDKWTDLYYLDVESRLKPRECKIKVLIDFPSHPPSFHTLATSNYLHKNVNMAKIDGEISKVNKGTSKQTQ